MKHMLAILGLLVFAAFGVANTGMSWAVTTPTIGQVLAVCPDWENAKACPGAADGFVSPRNPPTDQTDRQMVSLAVQLVELLQAREDVPEEVCLDVAAGIKVLAEAMLNPGQAEQLEEIAATLCEETIQTAAIGDETGDGGGGGGGGGNGPPVCDTDETLIDGVCVPNDTDPVCADDEHLENGVCVPNDTGSECDVGQHLDENGRCVADDTGSECDVGQHLDENGRCVPNEGNPPACDDDETLVNGVCVPDDTDPACEDDEHLENGVCVPNEGNPPVCDDDETLVNGVCVPDDEGNDCPAGTHPSGDDCVPNGNSECVKTPTNDCNSGHGNDEDECDDDNTGNGGNCEEEEEEEGQTTPPLTCTPPAKLENGACVAPGNSGPPTSCPEGQHLDGDKCKKDEKIKED